MTVSHFPVYEDNESLNEKLSDFITLCIDRGLTQAKALIKSDKNTKLLCGIFANSPYLTSLCFKMPELVIQSFETDATEILTQIQNELAETTEYESQQSLKQILREAKLRISLLCALADITETWTLQEVTKCLSDFAEYSLNKAVDHLFHEARLSGDISFKDDSKTGFIVLGMGKLGGRELNYSSDIDLIILYDPEMSEYHGKRSKQDFFIKFTRNLASIMQERTADGYVFRTDLRLRPDPGATPPAMSVEAAEVYYQSMGLNWERAAMIKARPVAGDHEAAETFLNNIRGFVWRKSLDYEALEDIYAIKKLIHRHHQHGDIAVAGQDIKLGPGGIREIEFYAQIHQLISGGREPDLRIAPTLMALDQLVVSERLSPEENNLLQEAYRYFRTLEHRLQMINDDQTHTIPEAPDEFQRISNFMGFSEPDDFIKKTSGYLQKVHSIFDALLKDMNKSEEEESTLSFLSETEHAPTLQYIAEAGYPDASVIYKLVQNWLLGRYRACRTDRARQILETLLPDILNTFARHPDPQTGLMKFDDFISRLPSGVQLFSFIKTHPWLLDLLSDILSIAPTLSDELSKNTSLLDAVLDSGFFVEYPTKDELAQSLDTQLDTARDFQDILDISRKWANERKFQVGVQILRQTSDAQTAGQNLSDIADVILDRMLVHVKAEFAKKHGVIEGASLAILAMGKLGGGELTSTSDLDMIFIYDHRGEKNASDGAKSLTLNHYYARLSQNYINALSALTGEGRLYEIDMRLRPSGTAGPIAVTLKSFQDYQNMQAWTWEHMALTRARISCGDQELSDKVNQTIETILTHQDRDSDNLLYEVSKMRKRLRKEFGTDNIWALKHTKGGLVDIEFICQYFILKHAVEKPSLLVQNTYQQIIQLTEAGIFPNEQGQKLARILDEFQNLQFILRLCMGSATNSQNKPDELVKILLKRFNAASLAALENEILENQKFVFDVYEELIEKPAQDMIPPEPITPFGKPVKNK